MNAESAEPPPLVDHQLPAEGWSRRRWWWIIGFAFAAHLALVFLFGTTKTASPRPVTNAPQIQLAHAGSELIALTDPTLFARPHLEAFAPDTWLQPSAIAPPVFRWTEPPPLLPPAPENLGAAFTVFLETNRFAVRRLDFKPAAQLIIPMVKLESDQPLHSTMQITGELAQRRLLNPFAVPPIDCNDILKPSRVQVLVNADGRVVSLILIAPSDWKAADDQALALARAAQFTPASGLVFGELIFNWRTVPTNSP